MALNPKLAAQREADEMFKGMMQADSELVGMKSFIKFVVVYLLQQDGESPGWRKAGIEGTLFIAECKSEPKYKLIVKNKTGANDLVDAINKEWDVDIKTNYVFYKVEDPAKRIRGLWIPEDDQRQKLGEDLENLLNEIGKVREDSGPTGPSDDSEVKAKLQSMGKTGQVAMPTDQVVQANAQIMRHALHTLVDDENWIEMWVQGLKANNTPGAFGGVAKPSQPAPAAVGAGGARKRQG